MLKDSDGKRVVRRKNNKDIETWLPVPDYEGLYLVSDRGNIQSLPRLRKWKGKGRLYAGSIMAQQVDRGGYLRVPLTDADGKVKRKRVHRLVVLAFKPDTLGKYDRFGNIRDEVNHLDFDKKNNNLDNLVASSSEENLLHSITDGEGYPYHWTLLNKYPYSNKKQEIEFWPKGKPEERLTCIGIAPTAKLLGIKPKGVASAVNGRTKSSQGYVFRYVEKGGVKEGENVEA